jgi:hypothetical protein
MPRLHLSGPDRRVRPHADSAPDQIVLDHVAARETISAAPSKTQCQFRQPERGGLTHVLALLETEARCLPAEVVRIQPGDYDGRRRDAVAPVRRRVENHRRPDAPSGRADRPL